MADNDDKKSGNKTVLRSASWFGTNDKNGFMYRSWMKNQGIPDDYFQGKPWREPCLLGLQLQGVSVTILEE